VAGQLFGTDGVRGRAGEFLTAELALGLARAAVAHALDIHPDKALHLAIFNLSLTCLERHPDGWRVVSVNELPGY